MIIFSILFLCFLFDCSEPIAYTCNRQSICGCSKRSTVVLSKIIGGEPVYTPYAWGWIASLRRDGIHQCGASLVTPSHVVTAAHCLQDIQSSSRLSLHFGIVDLSDIGQLRNVSRMYVHPEFNQTSYVNDIAVLRLHEPLDLTNSNTSCICLPTTSEFDLSKAEYPPIDANLIAIGWGTIDPYIRVASPILRQVTVDAIDRGDVSCLNAINDDVVQFCAGIPDGGKDTCYGDSGGPLMLFKDGRWRLVGVTSFGQICGSPGFAGVYTRIAYYISYIQDIINSDDINVINGKQLIPEEKSTSNTVTLYHRSNFEYSLICLFLVTKTLFR